MTELRLRSVDGDRGLHERPPATPSSFFATRRWLLGAIGVSFVLLALGAAIGNGWLPRQWDVPIQHFVESHRTSGLNSLFLMISRFGSTVVVLAAGALFAMLTWTRCRAVGLAVIVATLSRPPVEALLKEIVGRDRPNFGRLVAGTGYAFPSGHVLAAIALYGLLPVVVGLFTRSRVLWWCSVGVAGALITGIAASRVYLGVHWFSDVVGSLLLGSFFLLGVEACLGSAHRATGCDAGSRPVARRRVVASTHGGSGGVGPDVGEHAASVPGREGPDEP